MKFDLSLRDGRVYVRSLYAPALVERYRSIPGHDQHRQDKCWSFPATRDVCLTLCDIAGILPEMLPADIAAIVGPQQNATVKLVDLILIADHAFTTTPYEHQRVGLAQLVQESRWLMAWEQGVGKTFIVCNRIKRFLDQNEEFPRDYHALILCPKSVLSVWRDELKKHALIACNVVDGPIEVRKRLIAGYRHIRVANYEALIHTDDAFDKIDWDTVVLDEVHRVKNFTAQTSKRVRKLTAKAKHVWGLSGTPFPNGIEDCHGVLAAIKPDLLPVQTKTAFEARYCVKSQLGPGGPFVITGYRNVAELHGYIASISSRVTKSECLDLPPKVYSTRTVQLQGEQARVYRELKRDAVARIGSLKHAGTLSVRNVLTEGLRLLQVVGGFVPDDEGTLHELDQKCKVAALAEVLDEVGDRQVVIWCQFKQEVVWLAEWLRANYGGGVTTFTGDVSGSERGPRVEAFQKGEYRYFIGTAAAGGTGVTLHAADTEVFYSRGYNLAEYLQAVDRCHRIGTRYKVSVIRLVAENTIDGKIHQALEDKADMMQMMLSKPEEWL